MSIFMTFGFGGKGFPVFSEQAAFVLSSVQDLFVNFCFCIAPAAAVVKFCGVVLSNILLSTHHQ